MEHAAPPSNASFIPPAAMDLLLVVPRLAQRAGNFALVHMPEAMDNIAGKIFNGGSMIADATGQQTVNSTITNTSNHFAQSTSVVLDAAFGGALKQAGDDTTASFFGMMLQGFGKVKNFGGIFSYLTSRWAVATFTAAIILNRAQFYASSREHLRLRWYVRLALYITPICAFLVQLLYMLQALRCQTSPDFALLRYGDPLKRLSIDFGGDGGFLYKLSSTLLFWQDDLSCCTARHMSLVAAAADGSEVRGSMSLLFSFFLTLCTSQLFETLSCALQGKQPMPETGMTLFEHSLAFAECEAMISSYLGFGFFGQMKMSGPSSSTSAGESSGPIMSRGELLQRLNVPPEVLLVCVISCFSHLSSAILAITGLRHKVRLVNSGVWACCYMSAFLWCFSKVVMNPIESLDDLGILRFPTVCIVGFIPHLLVLIGIFICAAIYVVALLITAVSVPQDAGTGMSFGQRLAWAYQNLQANVQFSATSSIRIKMSEDFYTTLLKVGFAVLTAASEAVYLNEGSRIQVAQMTWLEQKRIGELATSMDRRNKPNVPSELLGDGIAKGVEFTDHHNTAISPSPYARERKSRPTKSDQEKAKPGELDSGLGLAQRRNRMQLTLDFIAGMFWLVIGVQAQLTLNTLGKIGIGYRPSWLLKAAGVSSSPPKDGAPIKKATKSKPDFYLLGPDGKKLRLPKDPNLDVEVETRRRWHAAGADIGEDSLSESLYRWWSGGGWFGDLDGSGDYEAPGVDDDTTSMISMSTNASTNDDWSDVEESGRRTPTQFDPYGERSQECTPEPEGGFDVGMLARLLNPQSTTDRDEARLLSHTLQSTRPMTRAQYRRETDRSRAQLLAGIRGQPANPFSEEEEEREMEQFILEQRSKGRAQASAQASRGGPWETGAEGMGAGGPQCVVCQSTPRTILVWPCGCLSMCDDCRVGLAARNYSKCICCRTDIAAYSRLYVP
jgi:hypothetical protein